jgi:hypothetical protein
MVNFNVYGGESLENAFRQREKLNDSPERQSGEGSEGNRHGTKRAESGTRQKGNGEKNEGEQGEPQVSCGPHVAPSEGALRGFRPRLVQERS